MEPGTGEAKQSQDETYDPDSPIDNPSQDKLERWAFAKRIANCIANIIDERSLVFGISGKWGEGKTSVLKLIHHALLDENQIIRIWYNPWQYKDEIQLLRSFFETIADVCTDSDFAGSDKLAKALRMYGNVLAPFSFSLAHITFNPSSFFLNTAKELSNVKLSDKQREIEGYLRKADKRLVVFIDDLDRLDVNEICLVFKLVKLLAKFACTTYILAFDYHMVTDALSSRYKPGLDYSWGEFIEKIVQVQLPIPKVSHSALREFFLSEVEQALETAGIKLDEQQEIRFMDGFWHGLEVRVKTPRLAKRYRNALLHAMPILKDEVDPVDLMLLEGVRTFFPILYDVIRDNKKLFIGFELELSDYKGEEKEGAQNVIEAGFAGLNAMEKKAANSLIRRLFPRTEPIFGGPRYSADFGEIWANGKRVASQEYFDRYFSYTISKRDISDVEFSNFLSVIHKKYYADIAVEIKTLVKEHNAEIFTDKVRRIVETIAPEDAERLAMAISISGDLFPDPLADSLRSPADLAGMVISDMIERIPWANARLALARNVILKGCPIWFANICLRWLRVPAESSRISEEEERTIGQAFAGRIRDEASRAPLVKEFGRQARFLLFTWARYRSKEETNEYILKMTEHDSSVLAKFIEMYFVWPIGIPRGTKSSSAHIGQLFNEMKAVVDPGKLVDLIYGLFGEDDKNYESTYIEEQSYEKWLLLKFVSFYRSQSKPNVIDGE